MTELPRTGLPVISAPETPETAPFWQGLRDGVLLLPRCESCAQYIWYPRGSCPRCGADVAWVESPGTGIVYSRSIVRRGAPEGFAGAAPYVVALVELDEGPRVYTNVVTADPDAVEIGQRVHLRVDRDGEAAALRFAPGNGETDG